MAPHRQEVFTAQRMAHFSTLFPGNEKYSAPNKAPNPKDSLISSEG